MKPLIQRSLMLGLMSSTLLSPSLIGSSVQSNFLPSAAAVALPAQEVAQRLQPVPVFTITNAQGRPLLGSQSPQQKAQVGLFFYSQKDAQTLLDQVKAKNPEVGKSARVATIGLDQAYELTQKNPQEAVFRFVPQAKQVQSAVKILQAEGKKVEQFNTTPVFFAVAGKDKGYLTIQQGNQQVIPLFLSKEDLDGLLAQLKQKDPQLAATAKVGVGSVEGVVKLMKEKNEPALKQLTIIPSKESVQYVQSQQKAAASSK